MSAIIQGYQLRALQLGSQVIKAAQLLPQTATATLATVAGGAVLVTSMLGLVTVATGATATNLSLGTVPTTGTPEAAGIAANGAIASLEIGTWMGPVQSSGVAAALAVGVKAGTALFLTTPMVIQAGTISWTTSASNTGQIKWYFTYVPLDVGASLS